MTWGCFEYKNTNYFPNTGPMPTHFYIPVNLWQAREEINFSDKVPDYIQLNDFGSASVKLGRYSQLLKDFKGKV